MNLKKKKKLMARVLKVGVGRIKIENGMIEEIKEAIARQDIKDLKKQGTIKIKEKNGRRKRKKQRKKLRKKTVKDKKRYVRLVRKLRSYIKKLKKEGKLNKEEYYDLRKKIKMSIFKDASHLKEYLGERK